MLDALTMSDGRSIPAQGFGVFQIPAKQTADAVAQAIEVGYRHIDTAQAYFNEATGTVDFFIDLIAQRRNNK